VVGREDGPVARFLVTVDGLLGLDVFVHVAVDVKVVRGDVEDRPHVRTAVDQLKLEAGELEDDGRLRTELENLLDERVTDVAAHDDAQAGAGEHVADQGRGGGLPGAAGHPDRPGPAEAQEETDLRGYLGSAGAGGGYLGEVLPHPRGEENEVGFPEDVEVAGAQAQVDGERRQPFGRGRAELGGRLGVAGDDVPRPAGEEEPE